MQNRIKVAVSKIVELILRCGDIDSRFNNPETMKKGVELHRKIQSVGGEFYKKEVSLKYEAEIFDIPIEIKGRADGIILNPDGSIIIDEIKTTILPLDQLYKQHSVHLGQGKCYAFMLMETFENPPEFISVQLTYMHQETEEIAKHIWHFSRLEIETFFNDLLSKYGIWLKFEYDHKIKRDLSIKELTFPFTFRKGQREFAAAVYRTISAEKKLYATAPTGIGKTLSTIFPTVKAMGENKVEKIFYLTAKTVTRVVAEEAVKLMTEKGLHFLSTTLRAKDKICQNEKRICSPEHCTNAKGHFDRINDALWELINNTFVISPNEITLYSQKHNVCPHELALDASLFCDLIVGDYNHVFDPSSYLRRFFMGYEKNDYVFLIDEAHNLADRVRDMYSVSLSKGAFSNTRKNINGKDILSKDIRKILRQINSYMLNIKKENEKSFACKNQDMNFKSMIEDYIVLANDWLKNNAQHEFFNEMLNLYFEVNMYMLISSLYDEHFTTLFEIGNDITITLFCLDPSQVITNSLSRGISTIMFSATLSPLGFYREILGGSEDDNLLSLPSPFDPSFLKINIEKNISTKFIHRESSYEPICKAIFAAVSQKKGNYFVFFPSYDYLNKVYSLFCEMYPDINTILQTNDMTEESREEFLNSFDENNTETLIGFTVLGGIFSEGIDLKGNRLIGSIIVGVGLPMINFRQDKIKEYFNEKNNQGFDFAYVFPGMNKVLQAAGRVIRTETDSGILLLIDSRFVTGKYKQMFPAHWTNIKTLPV